MHNESNKRKITIIGLKGSRSLFLQLLLSSVQRTVEQKTEWQQQPRAECPDKVPPFAVCLRKRMCLYY